MTTLRSAMAALRIAATVLVPTVLLTPTTAPAQDRPSPAELQVEGQTVRIALEESGFFPATPHPDSEGQQYISAVEVAFDRDIPAQSVRLRFDGNLKLPLSRPLTFALAAAPEQGLYRLFEIRSLDMLDQDVARIEQFLELVAPERRRRRSESETEVRVALLDLHGDRLSMESSILSSLDAIRAAQPRQLACSVTVEYALGTRDPARIWLAETDSNTRVVEYSDGTSVRHSGGCWANPRTALGTTWHRDVCRHTKTFSGNIAGTYATGLYHNTDFPPSLGARVNVQHDIFTSVNMSTGRYTVVPEWSEWGASTAALLSTWRIWAAVWSSGACGW